MNWSFLLLCQMAKLLYISSSRIPSTCQLLRLSLETTDFIVWGSFPFAMDDSVGDCMIWSNWLQEAGRRAFWSVNGPRILQVGYADEDDPKAMEAYERAGSLVFPTATYHPSTLFCPRKYIFNCPNLNSSEC